MKGDFVVKVDYRIFDEVKIEAYIRYITSYSKGEEGAMMCPTMEKAHVYKSDRTARRAAEAYNGIIKRI